MGLVKAALGAASGVMGDQWKEYFTCSALPADVLAVKGEKKQSGRSANRHGSENIITDGSIVAVAEGQCALIVEQGKVVDLCAEPGEYTYNTGTQPSLLSGGLAKNIDDAFAEMGKRFAFGGQEATDQRIYYINTKELPGNKYGTPNPVPFRVQLPHHQPHPVLHQCLRQCGKRLSPRDAGQPAQDRAADGPAAGFCQDQRAGHPLLGSARPYHGNG